MDRPTQHSVFLGQLISWFQIVYHYCVAMNCWGYYEKYCKWMFLVIICCWTFCFVTHTCVILHNCHWITTVTSQLASWRPYHRNLDSFKRTSKRLPKLFCLPLDFPNKGPVTRKLYRFDDVIIILWGHRRFMVSCITGIIDVINCHALVKIPVYYIV